MGPAACAHTHTRTQAEFLGSCQTGFVKTYKNTKSCESLGCTFCLIDATKSFKNVTELLVWPWFTLVGAFVWFVRPPRSCNALFKLQTCYVTSASDGNYTAHTSSVLVLTCRTLVFMVICSNQWADQRNIISL